MHDTEILQKQLEVLENLASMVLEYIDAFVEANLKEISDE